VTVQLLTAILRQARLGHGSSRSPYRPWEFLEFPNSCPWTSQAASTGRTHDRSRCGRRLCKKSSCLPGGVHTGAELTNSLIRVGGLSLPSRQGAGQGCEACDVDLFSPQGGGKLGFGQEFFRVAEYAQAGPQHLAALPKGRSGDPL